MIHKKIFYSRATSNYTNYKRPNHSVPYSTASLQAGTIISLLRYDHPYTVTRQAFSLKIDKLIQQNKLLKKSLSYWRILV
ncbi:hypothetical protein PAHAL_4G050400 [Panicum hallii]|uniref:Uncharacterized protein n=1 Tax=Panicum hallii TaxID=206008 RepID=A0A2T8JBU1_9POAL|nr:hypothetical protein PAHAL_4G050400 [Panicum hallii]